ncbi:MAG: GDSL-type esterase/lipase family protein [Kiritimatiellia bacterium]
MKANGSGFRLRWAWLLPLAAAWPTACAPAVRDEPVDVAAYPQRVRLACVGDSLTGCPDSWPVHLEGALDARWEIRNFGLGGATVLSFGDTPYLTLKLPEVLAYQPDVVVILLGTNDSKMRHWYYRKEFERDYRRLVADVQALPSRPRIWICLPPPAFPGQWGVDAGRLREMVPVIRRVARRQGVPVIDLHAALLGHPEYFPDQIHPDVRGSIEIARHVYRALTGRTADF